MLSVECMYCLIKRQMEVLQNYEDEEKKSKYLKEVFRIIANAKENETAPVIIAHINELHETYFKKSYSFDALKKQYNKLLLDKENIIEEFIQNTEDPLLTAIKYARVGNYIDFGAMGTIDNEKLESLLENASSESIDMDEYIHFKEDLFTGKHLVYLTDNCGEVVLDKLLIQTIKKLFPHIDIKIIVRGMPVLNDVTIEDAKMVGLTNVGKVIENGTKIAGTHLDDICGEAKEAINQADLIISKGQGNFETLHGCGLNIYYMFLCKCDWFVKRFKLKQYEGVFINEKNNRIK